jgi:hypothetical protein
MIFWFTPRHTKTTLKCWIMNLNGSSKTTSTSNWTNAFSATRKSYLYLGFTHTPDGIKPGKKQIESNQGCKKPTDVKIIRSFIGLCKFFQTHIKFFAIIAAPLFKLTRKIPVTKVVHFLKKQWMLSAF